jgi:uncharacterized protein (TIGR03435 family)
MGVDCGGKLLLVAVGSSVVAFSQTQSPAAHPQFEVASIKVNHSGRSSMGVNPLPGGRLITDNAPLRLIIQNAYGVRSFQVLGAPGWVESDRWDINAKAEGNASRRELMEMLQVLLETRFNLTFHRETKEFPVYSLTASKNGLKLPNANEEICAPPETLSAPPTADQAPPKPCGRVAVMLSARGDKLKGENVTTTELARVLGNIMDRPVVEKTGFKGTFDIDADFIPDQLVAGLPSDRSSNSAASAELGGTSIFAALQQFGMRLESSKGPVEVFVIDHVEKASTN